ncbi:MAG TPA: bacillithiol biosynthesis deacetylase BshB1 [Flavobacteriales bacterium]|nr:bacillithiol biosynthesis deacetylase BshB1 [Flavobacteriales bacterium]
MALEKVNILAIGVHPDDVELSCSGTLIKSVQAGKKVGLLDLTHGELGTRGSGEIRLVEAENARKVIGASFRVNLGLKDGFFENNEAAQMKIIEVIRACQPDIVLCNALRDRHPDHGRSAEMEKVACFLSGLRRIETTWEGVPQKEWRPKQVMHYIQDYFAEPNVVVDISGHWEQKMESILAYSSQFYNPESKDPESPISSKAFLDVLKGRAQNFGRYVNVEVGEGFLVERPVGVQDLNDIF